MQMMNGCLILAKKIYQSHPISIKDMRVIIIIREGLHAQWDGRSNQLMHTFALRQTICPRKWRVVLDYLSNAYPLVYNLSRKKLMWTIKHFLLREFPNEPSQSFKHLRFDVYNIDFFYKVMSVEGNEHNFQRHRVFFCSWLPQSS